LNSELGRKRLSDPNCAPVGAIGILNESRWTLAGWLIGVQGHVKIETENWRMGRGSDPDGCLWAGSRDVGINFALTESCRKPSLVPHPEHCGVSDLDVKHIAVSTSFAPAVAPNEPATHAGGQVRLAWW